MQEKTTTKANTPAFQDRGVAEKMYGCVIKKSLLRRLIIKALFAGPRHVERGMNGYAMILGRDFGATAFNR